MPARSVKTVPDIVSILGFVLGIGGILLGLVLEGGNVADVAQVTGALIVLAGTLGAVMITTPGGVFLRAVRQIRLVLFEPVHSPEATISQILSFSIRARRNGIVSLEGDVSSVADPFLRKALTLAIDGTELEELKRIMELDLEAEMDRGRAEARVFESAGGYAPTVGIIGAVLGLIQVMKHLQEIEKVGHGIAVAFVATVYGVGLANLFFLPAAGKLKARVEQSVRMRELMLEGVCGIATGVHPNIIGYKLSAWTPGSSPSKGRAVAPESRLAEETA